MKVVHFQIIPCTRLIKYGYGFRNSDFELYFAYLGPSLTETYGYGDELFTETVKLKRSNLAAQIGYLVHKYDIDIVHAHGDPDVLTREALEALEGSDIPVLCDKHDAATMQTRERNLALFNLYSDILGTLDRLYLDEEVALKNSHGRIYVTEGLKERLEAKYNISGPSIVFPNFAPFAPKPRKKLSEQDGKTHIVYEGTLNEIKSKAEGHRDLWPVFDELVNVCPEVHLHIYALNHSEIYRKYFEGNERVHVHDKLDPRTLLEELPQYDLSLVVFNTDKQEEHMEVAVANKLYDCLAAGVPVITHSQHKEQARIIEKNKNGLVIDGFKDLNEQLKDKERIKEINDNVRRLRYQFTVDRHIHKIEEFYHSLVS
jgi:hypothetical protein